VKRQIGFLAGKFKIDVLCFGSAEIPEVRIIELKKTPLTLSRKALSGLFLLLKFYNIGHRILHDYSYIGKSLANQKYDLVIANDVETLPLAFELSGGAKVILDAHEYAPRHFEDKLWWRVFFKGLNNYLCTKYIPKIKAMTTVGTGLANEYKKHFGVNPTVVTNATAYHEIPPTPVMNQKIRMVYHGIANLSRKIELMIELMGYLDDRFTLDLILMTSGFASPKTRNYIENLGASIHGNNRIRILPQLPSEKVVEFINQYDVGVFLIPPINFNYANTLPNKLFEYIQARLAIAVGPTPEMAEIVSRYQIGVVSENFTAKSLADKLNAITAETLSQFKARSSLAAKDLCAENNSERFIKLVLDTLED
jgi:glycosyltransferase involved in cell wall biosynthesis